MRRYFIAALTTQTLPATLSPGFSVDFSFPVIFTRGAFDPGNRTLPDLFSGAGEGRKKVLLVVDSGVARATPDLMARVGSFAAANGDIVDFVARPLIVRGGEQCKNDPSEVAEIHARIERHGLCRHSFVLVLGGGAVLDLSGYAAATAHRGVRLVRMPTTTLAQNDAGIGVKNGVNAFGRKNFLGTFSPPYAVVNDFDFLNTLDGRDLRAGIAEAVKVALIRDAGFFRTLWTNRFELARFHRPAMEEMIAGCATLHLAHISGSGDPFEFGSARPLDFGHWIAHKLEEVTGGDLRHGEAVAVGLALDSLYSCRTRLLGEPDLHRILVLLDDLGFSVHHSGLGRIDVPKALDEFREHLGGRLSIPLLSGIGVSTDVSAVDASLYRECISFLAERERRRVHVPLDAAHRSGPAELVIS